MLTKEEIQQIVEAHQAVFATKEDLVALKDEMRADFSNLLTSVDAYAKRADTYFQEMVMLSHKVDKIEKWVIQLADKVGLKLQY